MNSRRLLIGLLLLAIVLVDVALVTVAWGNDFPHAAITGAWALQVAQVSLAAIWLAFGRLTGPLRLLVVLGIVIAWSDVMSRLDGASDRLWWIWLLLGHAAATTMPLLLARAAGLQLSCNTDGSATLESGQAPHRFQFSIAYLLAWTTAVAVVLSTLQYLMSLSESPLSIFSNWEWIFLVFCGGHAAIAITAFWLIFGTRWLLARIFACLFACLLAIAGFMWLFEGSSEDRDSHYLSHYALQVPLLLGALGVFRIAGYRLQWYGQPADPATPPSHHPDDEQQ